MGGLVGLNGYASVDNCYAIATAVADSDAGGLAEGGVSAASPTATPGAGFGRPECGRLGAGIRDTRDAIGCFWDHAGEPSEQQRRGDGKITSAMLTAATFCSWNPSDQVPIWTINEGQDYPRLSWEARAGQLIKGRPLSDILEGKGTVEAPYLIYTAEELNTIALYWSERDKHFKLMADIDLAAYAPDRFVPIRGLSGVFDGNHHIISNLVYRDAERNWVGLFANVWGPLGEVKNLGLVNFALSVR